MLSRCDRLRSERDEARAELKRLRSRVSHELRALKEECEVLAGDLEAKVGHFTPSGFVFSV